jgi:Protein of unknown function (DUF3300)
MLRLMIGRTVQLATMTAVCALAGAAVAQDMPPAPVPAAPEPQTAAPPSPTPSPQATASPSASSPQTADATPPAPQATSPAPQATPIGPAAPPEHPLNQAQLEQLVAPIALYPDPLLSQVLMASTYPLEVVEADRWVRVPANQALKGDALTQALEQQEWDPSIMALIPFPKLLALMADKLQWTQAIGNAFLAQQTDVMNAVQALRHDAMAAGNLKATPECHCVIQTSGNTISILPSETNVVCIPVYNPRVAYGAWPEPDYPPYYFPIPAGFAFEPGYAIGFYPFIELAAFGPLWGWGWIDWGHHYIGIDGARYAALGGRGSFAGGAWVHDPGHRGGVAYGDPTVTARFGAARVAAMGAAGRAAFAHGAVAGAAAGARFGAAGGAHFGAASAHAGGASFGRGGFGGATHASAEFHHGPVGRGPAPVRGGGGGHFGHANFAPARPGGGPHFGGGGGGHFGGGGGAHFGGGGGGHGGGGGGGGHGGGGHH